MKWISDKSMVLMAQSGCRDLLGAPHQTHDLHGEHGNPFSRLQNALPDLLFKSHANNVDCCVVGVPA